MAVRVAKLRAIANDILSQLTGWDDDELVETRCNTYGMEGIILEVREGFVDVCELRPELEEYDDEEEYL